MNTLEYIKDYSRGEIGKMLRILARLSKMDGISDEYGMLNKVEEELIECLVEVRRLKNHYDEIKAARKNLDDVSLVETIDHLVDEMGDVYTDLFLFLPSVIEIDGGMLNSRINKKLNVYERVLVEKYKIDPREYLQD
jgi:hypothetical protein